MWQARVRLAAGEWSNKFSLDAVGSGGALKVKKEGKLHEVSEDQSYICAVIGQEL